MNNYSTYELCNISLTIALVKQKHQMSLWFSKGVVSFGDVSKPQAL